MSVTSNFGLQGVTPGPLFCETGGDGLTITPNKGHYLCLMQATGTNNTLKIQAAEIQCDGVRPFTIAIGIPMGGYVGSFPRVFPKNTPIRLVSLTPDADLDITLLGFQVRD
jgi:hypothetical protein